MHSPQLVAQPLVSHQLGTSGKLWENATGCRGSRLQTPSIVSIVSIIWSQKKSTSGTESWQVLSQVKNLLACHRLWNMQRMIDTLVLDTFDGGIDTVHTSCTRLRCVCNASRTSGAKLAKVSQRHRAEGPTQVGGFCVSSERRTESKVDESS